jgi:chromosome segregation ATPase
MDLNGNNVSGIIKQLQEEYDSRSKKVDKSIASVTKAYQDNISGNSNFSQEQKELIRSAYMSNDKDAIQKLKNYAQYEDEEAGWKERSKALTKMLEEMEKGISTSLKPIKDAKEALEDLVKYKDSAAKINDIISEGIDSLNNPNGPEADLAKNMERLSKVLEKADTTEDITAALKEQSDAFKSGIEKILNSEDGLNRYANVVGNSAIDGQAMSGLIQEMKDAFTVEDGGKKKAAIQKATEDFYNAVSDAAAKVQETKDASDKAKEAASGVTDDIKSLQDAVSQYSKAIEIVSNEASTAKNVALRAQMGVDDLKRGSIYGPVQ